jgi:phage-related protein
MPYSITNWEKFVEEKDKQENKPITFYDIELDKGNTFRYRVDGAGGTYNSSPTLIYLYHSGKDFFNLLFNWASIATVNIQSPYTFRLSGDWTELYSRDTYIRAYVGITRYGRITGSVYNTSGDYTDVTLDLNISSATALWYGTLGGFLLDVAGEFVQPISAVGWYSGSVAGYISGDLIQVANDFINPTLSVDYYSIESVAHFCDNNQPTTLTLADGTEQTYTPFPINYDQVSTNITGEIDTLVVTVGNVSLELSGWLSDMDGLRGCQITIRKSFFDVLDQAGAYMEDIFFIDSAAMDEISVAFTLTSRLDINMIKIPKRIFYRTQCTWHYKESGCWLEDSKSWAASSNLSAKVVTSTPVEKLLTASYTFSSKGSRRRFQLINQSLQHYRDLFQFINKKRLDESLTNEEITTQVGVRLRSIKDWSGYGIDPNAIIRLVMYMFTVNPVFWTLTEGYPNAYDYFKPFESEFDFTSRSDMKAFTEAVSHTYVQSQRFNVDLSVTYRPRKRYYPPSDFINAGVSCDRTFDGPVGCKYHNNVVRFGGFPTIPYKPFWFTA